jgi:putative aldouronate transport system substrate-binding protein
MKTTRNSVWVAVMLVLVLIVTACGNNAAPANTAAPSNSGSSSQSSGASETPGAVTTEEAGPPTEISVFLNQQTPEVLPADNVIVKEIEKRTNTKLNLIWIAQNTMTEKTKITLSSGDIPDLMLIGSPTDPLYVTMARQGAFWDLTPYLAEYEHIGAIPEDIWNNLKVDGVNFGLPRVRPLDGGGQMPMLRKDWLDKLNLQMPETMDDMYAVMKAFTEQDPDGNGAADTVGLTGQVDPDGMGNLTWVEQVFNHTNGANNILWKLVDGKLVPTVFEQGTRDALEWLRNAYNDKILAQDFAIMKYSQSRDLLMGNKAGILGSAINPQWLFTDAIRKIDPSGDMLPVTHLISPSGEKWATKDSGHLGMFVIPKTVSEEKLKKILAFMDYGYSDEGSDLAIYGIEGTHYTVTDGFKTATEQAAADMVGQNILGTMFGKFEKYQRAFLTGIPKDMYERNVAVIDERAEISIPNPAEGIVSDTWSMLGADFTKKIQDMKTKVILGKESFEQWDKFVAGLQADANFQKIIDEMNTGYQNK